MDDKEFAKEKLKIAYQALKLRSLEEAMFKMNPDLQAEWEKIYDKMQRESQDYLATLSKEDGT